MSKRRQRKHRSLAQRIGEEGEALFALWATRNGLISNKSEKDYGIDFWCQRTLESETPGITIVGNTLFGVQVKATQGKSRKRVRIDRGDAEVFLNLKTPFCLCAVDLENDTVYFRFRDKKLVDEIVAFLSSEKQTKSW